MTDKTKYILIGAVIVIVVLNVINRIGALSTLSGWGRKVTG